MAKLETEHTFNGSINKVFSGMTQYSKYPDYLPGVTGIDILPPQKSGSTCQIRYQLKIIKEFYYILNMFEESPQKIHWDMAESNIMKTNNGAWEFNENGKKTKAVYSLDIKFKGLVPRAVTDKVAEASLPAMLTGFQKIIDEFGED